MQRRCIAFLFSALVLSWLLITASPSAAMICSSSDPVTLEDAKMQTGQVVFRGVVESIDAPVGKDAVREANGTVKPRDKKVPGRQATVRVTSVLQGDDLPDRVTVLSGGKDPDVVTSGDRFFVPGGEYEFYPRNNREPFRDDQCTQTFRVDEPAEPTDPVHAEMAGFPGATIGHDHSHHSHGGAGGLGTAPLTAALAIGLAAAGVVVVRRQQGRVPRSRRTAVAGVATLLLVVGMLAVPDGASASHNAGGQGRHWGRSAGQAQATPTVRDQTGVSAWATGIQGAIGSWNPTPHVQYAYVSGGSPSCNPSAPSFAGVTMCLAPVTTCGGATADACTTTYLVSGTNHNAYVIIQLNGSTLNTAGLRRAAACHELGHSLGLAHRASPASSCMRNPFSASLQTPDQHDMDQIQAMTSHTH